MRPHLLGSAWTYPQGSCLGTCRTTLLVLDTIDTLFGGLPLATPLERISALSIPEPTSGCVIWLGYLNPRGYGVFRMARATKLAHRVAWELRHGPITDGRLVCHRCDVRCCVNVDHLFLGTAAQNTADMMSKGRMPTGERSARAILSDSEVCRVDRLLREGVAQKDIAAALGVSNMAISDIARGVNWSSLTGRARLPPRHRRRAA